MSSNGLLIDLLGQALGTQPCGVVDFNQLHCLLLEMIRGIGKLGLRLPDGNIHRTASSNQNETATTAVDKIAEEPSRTEEERANEVSNDRKEEEETEAGPGSDNTTRAGRKEDAETSGVPADLSTKFGSRSVGAANVMSVLENKLMRLEQRMETLAVLPDVIEKSVADGGKPVQDLWISTSLAKRVEGTEEGLRKACSVLDDILKEIQLLKGLKGDVKDVRDKLEKLEVGFNERIGALQENNKTREEEMAAMNKRVSSLEEMPASDGGPSKAFVEDLEQRMKKLTDEVSAVKRHLETLKASEGPGNFLTSDSLEEKLKEALSKVASAEEMENAQKRLNDLEKSRDELMQQIKDLLAGLSEKVNSSDLASLMPQGGSGDISENVMAIILDLQTRMKAVEGKLDELASQQASMQIPPDLSSEVESLRQSLEELKKSFQDMKQEMIALAEQSGQQTATEPIQRDTGDYGHQILKLRERLQDLEKALSSLSEIVAQSKKGTPPPPQNADNKELMETLHRHLHELQSEQDKHVEFMKQLAEEIAVKEDHIKSLYGSVGELKETKADKHFVEAEVHGKADQKSVENKANRAWVDSNFSKLDEEIRDARMKILGHEQALQKALDQLSTDVDSKLDRLELEPLKQYLETRIESSISAPVVVRHEPEDLEPAGLRKGLNFNCLSCDRPVVVKHAQKPFNILPVSKSLPSHRSARAYTTYELDLIRQHNRRGLSEALSLPPSLRSCGGSHTTTVPHKRIQAARSMPIYAEDEYGIPLYVEGEETEIVGHDGRVYKGRLVPGNKKLPAIKRSMSAKIGMTRRRHSRSPTNPSPSRSQSPKNQKEQAVN